MSAPTEQPFIQFSGVTKRFGNKVVYRGLDLSLAKGEVFTIVGGSGVGKSVMLKMLIGLLRADSGTISFDGADVTTVEKDFIFRYRSAAEMLNEFRAFYGPMNKAFEALDETGRDGLARDIVALAESMNTATDGTLRLPCAYLEVVATKR